MLSPDGRYLTPAVGKRTTAVLGDLTSGVFTTVVSTDGEPESLDWCNFASMTRPVCNFSGRVASPGVGEVVGFTRLVALDADGANPKLPGQAGSIFDASLCQDDSDDIDWLVGSEGSVLMSRLYVPEEGKLGSLVASKKKGIGVDRVDVTNLRRDPVEGPREAADYMSDGRGNVRLISIVGASCGGYAALQSAAIEPSLYKAVVAIAPVTDLAMLKQDSRNFTNATLVPREIGSGPQVAEGSPLRQAAAIKAPVLLLHGDRDATVRVRHSQRMQDALRSAGKQSELLTFKGIDHYFEDATVRTEMLTRIGEMLDRTIGK